MEDRSHETLDIGTEDDAPANLLALVHVASNLIGRAFDTDVVAPFGLAIPDWRVMLSLADGRRDGSTAIAADWGMDKMSISRAVGRLAERDLVRRLPDPADKRRQTLTLTDAGRAIYAKIEPRATARYQELLAPLSEVERRTLRAALARLAGRARELG